MKNICEPLHKWANARRMFRFPFDESLIPLNGIYILFEKGERAHETNRIVRIGTHTGKGQLRSRLSQHFLVENKDRSIFRKNIGRALLARDHDPFLRDWELDLTSAAARLQHGPRIDLAKLRNIESSVTRFIQENFSFVVIRVDEKADRLSLESKLISTVAACTECGPSVNWLGRFSPKEKIRGRGLWLVNELNKKPFTEAEVTSLVQRAAT